MRISSFAKPVAAVFVLAVAAQSIGCAAPTSDEQVGTQRQAVGEGAGVTPIAAVSGALAGAQAALRIVSAIRDYQRYGQAEASSAQILDEVKKTRRALDDLSTQVGELQSALDGVDKDVLNTEFLPRFNRMTSLWNGWLTAVANGPDAQQSYLEEIRTKALVQDLLADLVTLDDLLVGKKSSSSLVTRIAQIEAGQGDGSIARDGIGRFLAEKRLVQEGAFLVVSLANATNGSVDWQQERDAFEARMEGQDLALLAATNLYNDRILADAAAARTAKIGACTYDDTYFFGVEMYPNDGNFYFDDAAWSPAGDAVQSHDYEGAGRTSCTTTRDTHVAARVAEVQSALKERLRASQESYRTKSAAATADLLVGSYRTTPKASWETPKTVTLTKVDSRVLSWNEDGASCTVRMGDDASTLSVDSGCALAFANGEATVKLANSKVSALVGPKGVVYAAVQQ